MLTTEDATAMAGLLDLQRKAIKTIELERRIAELEALAPRNRKDRAA